MSDAREGTTPVHLNNHHRNTLDALFQHPTSHNVRWVDVLSLLGAVGVVEERNEGKVKVAVGTRTAFFETPRDHNAGVEQIVELRHLLSDAGYAPERD